MPRLLAAKSKDVVLTVGVSFHLCSSFSVLKFILSASAYELSLNLFFIFSTSSRRIELMSFQAFDPPPIPTRIKEADENNASNTSLGKKYLP